MVLNHVSIRKSLPGSSQANKYETMFSWIGNLSTFEKCSCNHGFDGGECFSLKTGI